MDNFNMALFIIFTCLVQEYENNKSQFSQVKYDCFLRNNTQTCPIQLYFSLEGNCKILLIYHIMSSRTSTACNSKCSLKFNDIAYQPFR